MEFLTENESPQEKTHKDEEISYKVLKKMTLKLERENTHLEFLRECKEFNTTPKFIRIKNNYIQNNYKKEIRNFEKTILNKIIRKKEGLKHHMKKEIKTIREKMKDKYDAEVINEFERKIRTLGNVERQIYTKKHDKKLKFWMSKQRTNEIKKTEVPYLNLSKIELSKHQDAVLKLGPKFILENQINPKESIPKIENALSRIPRPEQDYIRSDIQKKMGRKMKEAEKDSEDIKILREMKKNRNIANIKTDKTGKIAILDRDEYNHRMEEAINELGTTIISKDPNGKLWNKTKELVKKGKWPAETMPIIKNHAPNTPRMFGTLKDHKPGMKMRPIVNKREGPTYDLERYMKAIYRNMLPTSEHSITSTEEFIRKISDLNIENDETIASFDIVKLYPSIDIEEISKITNQEIENMYQDKNITCTLQQANNLILNESYFKFNNTIYKQTTGVPMGSPVSGLLAEIKLRILEKTIIKNLGQNIKIWIRYVDDVFAVLKNTKGEDLLKNLNSIDKNIKFTIETEKNGTLNYLDVKVIRNQDDKRINTTVYRKPGKSLDIIHNNSKTPKEYKLAALRSLVNKAITICSNQRLLSEEIDEINKIAEKAGYKKETIKKLYKKRIKKLEIIPPAQKEKGKETYTSKIPYNKGLGIRLKRNAAKNNIKIPIEPDPNIFQRIRSDKDEIDPKQTAGIYKIGYTETEENKQGYYIGVTKRKISERTKEHERDCKMGKQTTALARLNTEKNIKIEFGSVKKIANYNNQACALMREAIEIEMSERACNDAEHATVNRGWMDIMRRRRRTGSAKEIITANAENPKPD